MKVSRTTWLVIAAGAFIIISAALGIVRFQQLDQQEELEEGIALAQSNLEQVQLERLSSQQAELEKQLSEATSQFETVKSTLSQPVGSITASSILFEIAKGYGLEVIEMTSPGPVSDSSEGITYLVLPLSSEVEGDMPKLVKLVTDLNDSFTTGIIESVTITIPEMTSSENASASIRLIINTYKWD